jgi:hypothetical protein
MARHAIVRMAPATKLAALSDGPSRSNGAGLPARQKGFPHAGRKNPGIWTLLGVTVVDVSLQSALDQ